MLCNTCFVIHGIILPNIQKCKQTILTSEYFSTKAQLQREKGKRFLPSLPASGFTNIYKRSPIETYLGSNERDLKPSQAISNVQLGNLKQRVTETVCDKVDTQYSGQREINCDIFHLFVNASLAVHSLKTTVASYRIREVMVK